VTSPGETNGLPVDAWVVPVGFPSLTAFVHGGFRAGDLVVLGGDAQSGTSSLAMALALRARAMGTPAVLLSSEHPPARLFERALSAISRLPLDVLRQSELDEGALSASNAAACHLREQSPLMMRLEGHGIPELERALDSAPGTRLLVVDGLESLLTDPTDRDDALAWAVLSCKRLALRRELVVLLTTHLPLFDRRRTDLRPQLDDFGARGAIATHADFVLGLFREELYQQDAALTGAAELHLLKHRSGDLGYVDLYFEAPCLRFEDVMEA